MKIAILGFGSQGRSAYKYWHDGNEITICDADESIKVPDGAEAKLGKDYLKDLGGFDLLIRTPALHPKEIVAANSSEILEKVWSNTNEFFKVCPTKNIIGVTGTKGKGTTSTLIAKILEAADKKVHLGGNIGTPPLELLKNDIKDDDWVVLELANFQLIDFKTSPPIAVCLMVEPEHMDWHDDFEEYIAVKQQLFINQSDSDVAIFYAKNENSESVAGASSGVKMPYFEPPGAIIENDDVVIDTQSICSTNELKLLGQHNWQNVCAAVTTVWQITKDIEAMRSVLTTFSGLEHRLELVREFGGVKYYDDSFGTTPSTAQVATEAFEEPKVLILGGSDKGSNYDELAETIATSSIRRIILVGNTTNKHYKTATPKIEAALKNRGVDNIESLIKPGGVSMEEIVKRAHGVAKPGDVVLLSTACASFDMFKNYKDRSKQFKTVVLKLS